MSNTLNQNSGRLFEEQWNKEVLEAFLQNRENAETLVSEGVRDYVTRYLTDKDKEACVMLLQEDLNGLLALPSGSVTIAQIAIPKLLALFPNFFQIKGYYIFLAIFFYHFEFFCFFVFMELKKIIQNGKKKFAKKI